MKQYFPIQIGVELGMQREAKDVYTGVVPYLYRVLRRQLRRWGRYQGAEVEEEERCGLIIRRLRDVERV